MANLKTVLLTSVLSVLVASNVMAALQDHHDNKDKRQHSLQHQRGDHKDHKQGNASSQHAKNTHEAQHKRGQATSQWKAGNKLPEKYHSHNFKVTPNAHKLPQPGKNQRWIKVDRHYILENVLTHTIVKVISV